MADVIEIGPSQAGPDCVEEFEQIANQLQPGDTLVLRGGRYEQSCRRALSIQGTAAKPIMIRAKAGETPVLTRPADNLTTENNLELLDARHLTISGIEFEGGSIGVRLMGQTSHFTLNRAVIRGTGINALAANNGDSTHLVLTHNVISQTGLAPGAGEGEGFYLGCHNGSCRVTGSRIAYNSFSDLNAEGEGGNEAVELKPGSGGNTIAHNRVQGTSSSLAFPCFTLYGGGEQPNIVEHNQLERCPVGVFATRDVIVRHNEIINPTRYGIEIGRHVTVGQPINVDLRANTVRSTNSATCLRLKLWGANAIRIRDNRLFCREGRAIHGDWVHNATFEQNAVSGRLLGVPLRRSGIRTLDRSKDGVIDIISDAY